MAGSLGPRLERAGAQGVRPGLRRLRQRRARWAYGACRAEITGPPTCPPDGEQIVDVLTMRAESAVAFIEPNDRLMADAVRLAIAMELV